MCGNVFRQFFFGEVLVVGLQGIPALAPVKFFSFPHLYLGHSVVLLLKFVVHIPQANSVVPKLSDASQSWRVEKLTALDIWPIDSKSQCVNNHLDQVVFDNVALEHRFLFDKLFQPLVLSILSVFCDLVDYGVGSLIYKSAFPAHRLV